MKYLLLIIPALYLTCLICPIFVSIVFVKNSTREDLYARIGLFRNSLGFNFRIPYFRKKGKQVSTEVKLSSEKQRIESGTKLKFQQPSPMQQMNQFTHKIAKAKIFSNIFLKYARLHKLSVKVNFGLQNAFQTGIVGGLAWIFLGNLEFLLKKMHKSRDYDKFYQLNPNYDFSCFEMETEFVFSMRGIHFVMIGISNLVYEIKRRIYQWKITKSTPYKA
ncbi:DUF2953 domain-containing protein [Natranaerobius thermophilus]|uniref:DUF2953 domain-containing protein n=1 Tax=Natranaerobius thermophilus (strain ATCC BAA-1301 / DSM 18059 / JW/NM-WN-LF) TaxID=457570 RepID=B2A4Y2_NATTJ|nr:DUF2953 domain-containing protein [Natranaerobius thermophilus]ACB85224.1 hypothetical protein Nther_1650 [Natranaerobius thermophilus JW/NM-WN-LF]